jgi:hypothetical protein
MTLAAHNYESANGHLPPGALWQIASDTPYGVYSDPTISWNTQLSGSVVLSFPYIEQENLYCSLLNASPAPGDYYSITKRYPDYSAYSAMWALRSNVVKGLLCPSNGAQLGDTDLQIYSAQTSATGGLGLSGWYWGAQYNFGKSNYTGVGGRLSTAPDPFKGVYTPRSKTRLVTITDGTSNTFMFGEYNTKTIGGTRYALNWFEATYLPTAWGLTAPKVQDDIWYTFNSRHPGVVLFSLNDGSVRGVRHVGFTGTPYDDYIGTSGMSDGKVTNPDSF